MMIPTTPEGKTKMWKVSKQQQVPIKKPAYQWESSYHSPLLEVGILVSHPETG